MPIVVQDLAHTYMPGTKFEVRAVASVNLFIPDGQFLGIIGPTGSGKSTLIQHFNGLLKPTAGRVLVDGADVFRDKASWRDVRRKVGLIFQYPEHQLFEETVRRDVSFGPRNLGLAEEEIERRVKEALGLVGVGEDLAERSPFELSGGQMRRVAMAGVLAMEPKYLVLDEPTAGLDPQGRDEILGRIKDLHSERGITVILVSHSMEEIARLVERLVVMDKGRVVLEGPPREVFLQDQLLRGMGLDVPQMTRLMSQLALKGVPVKRGALTVEEARDSILEWKKGRTSV
ncbi:MAG: energy-coupling factor transporter ATPase [Bacillota bacterium]